MKINFLSFQSYPIPIIQMTREGTFFWYFKTIFLTAEFKVIIRSPKFNVSGLSFLSNYQNYTLLVITRLFFSHVAGQLKPKCLLVN